MAPPLWKNIMRQYPRSTRLAIITLYLRLRRARLFLQRAVRQYPNDEALTHRHHQHWSECHNALQAVIRVVCHDLHD